jgi:hypothetical protein
MEFPQGKSNKQNAVAVKLSKRLTLKPYFNLNVVDRVGTFMQTATVFGVRRVPSGVTWAAFSRVVARCFSLFANDPEGTSVSDFCHFQREVVIPEELGTDERWRSL